MTAIGVAKTFPIVWRFGKFAHSDDLDAHSYPNEMLNRREIVQICNYSELFVFTYFNIREICPIFADYNTTLSKQQLF